ncbi:PadR family transcriptional regulator [Nocardia asteroides]|uniref:PadR family transcriptional regulator n=1 Tax=Nocardia asteroides TaxID=1824 RepID=UPI001E50C9FE|nr:PadR family transcriptional regulator [Nocardia asteroides]UGT62747.1 PadR family transcriptional regulator [Nocardia asteroides]
MALRHAVLAALLDGELSGYQLAKLFDINISNYWHALPQQLYTELARLETEGVVAGRQVIQVDRPNKRVYSLTDAGRKAMAEFIGGPSKPPFVRDDLLVKMQAAELGDLAQLIEQLEDRAAEARARVEQYDKRHKRARGDLDEETFLATSPRVGDYLVGLRGKTFEQSTLEWCDRAVDILKRRLAGEAEGNEHGHRESVQRDDDRSQRA